MGIDFRSSGYVRRVKFGKRTVKAGEAAAIWNSTGHHRQIVGPSREYLWFSTVRFLDRFTASNSQYLIVKHRDGKREHIRGPAVLFANPVLHESVAVADAIQLVNSSEVLVVYQEVASAEAVAPPNTTNTAATVALGTKTEKKVNAGRQALGRSPNPDSSVSRRFIHGPAVFVPEVGEWTHVFKWSGHVPRAPGAQTGGGMQLKKGAQKFSVLRTHPQEWSVDVQILTSDNMYFTASISFRYQLSSVEVLLSASEDPVSDWWSGIEADVACVGDRITSTAVLEDRKSQVRELLSNLDTFPMLVKRMGETGFDVSEVFFRGHYWSADHPILQQLHKEAAAKSEAAAREVSDVSNARAAEIKEISAAKTLEAAQARADIELDHKQQRIAKEHAIKKQVLEHETELKATRLKTESSGNDETIRFLRELHTMDVDLTSLLTQRNASSASAGEPAKLAQEAVSAARAALSIAATTSAPPPTATKAPPNRR